MISLIYFCAACSLMLLLSSTALQAGTIKLSFLEDETAVRATGDFLLAHGTGPDAISAFKSAIAHYNLNPPGFMSTVTNETRICMAATFYC